MRRSRRSGAARRFADRWTAGRQLAPAVAAALHGPSDAVTVLALPRGGVPVARPIADHLGAPLDVLLVRKLGAPGRPELAIGAIGEDGARYLDRALLDHLDVPTSHLDAVTASERDELARRAERYRGQRPPAAVHDRTVVLVDDGIATGSTVRAALEVLAARAAARVVVAVPVAARAAATTLRPLVAELVALHVDDRLGAVGAWYRDFAAVTDAEVLDALDR